MKKMVVDLQEHSYPIYIEQEILQQADKYIKDIYQGQKIMIISDDQVYGHYGDALTKVLSKDFIVSHAIVPHGEESKRFDILPSLYASLLEAKITRTDLIIALGGGVIGDLAGFVAATYLRGVKFVQIPTSLLAQVDSSVGGKVAVDLPEGKNLVGAFYHPKMVLIDPTTLNTLPKRYINDGMGEVIKYGCIVDKELFTKLENYQGFSDLYQDIDMIIYRCVDSKRIVVEADQFDFGDRLLLNFGHTLGHAIEQYYQYKKYSHGEAVAIGMVQLTRLTEEKGISAKGSAKRIEEMVQKYHLPIESNVATKDLLGSIALDKKNIHKKLSLIVIKEIGKAFVYPCESSFLLEKEIV